MYRHTFLYLSIHHNWEICNSFLPKQKMAHSTVFMTPRIDILIIIWLARNVTISEVFPTAQMTNQACSNTAFFLNYNKQKSTMKWFMILMNVYWTSDFWTMCSVACEMGEAGANCLKDRFFFSFFFLQITTRMRDFKIELYKTVKKANVYMLLPKLHVCVSVA